MKGPRDVPVFVLLSRLLSLSVEQHVFAGPRVGISMQFPRKRRILNWVFSNPYAVFQLAADSLLASGNDGVVVQTISKMVVAFPQLHVQVNRL